MAGTACGGHEGAGAAGCRGEACPGQGFVLKIFLRKLEDGRMISLPPEDMFPFLPREELQRRLLSLLDDENAQSVPR